jgi:DedD protein
MAFFKFRNAGDESANTATPPAESVEAIRKRARHRLVGAAVLVLVGVLGFPLIFDSQPRPIAVDIPIEIPDKAKTKPLLIPAAPQSDASATTQSVAPAAKPPAAVAPQASSGKVGENDGVAKPLVPAPEKPIAKVDTPRPEAPKTEASKPVEKAATAKVDEAAKVQALLEGRPVPAAAAPASAGGERFIVQVGAFAEAAKAHETRLKMEHAGLKTYAQEVSTSEGKRIRVRMGPYASRAEADSAADKVKKLGLSAAILTL